MRYHVAGSRLKGSVDSIYSLGLFSSVGYWVGVYYNFLYFLSWRIFSTREAEKVIEGIMPHKWENDRKKSSTTSSLKMDRKSNAGNRKSRKFRSISRSLILCNAKNSDDGSSPDEKCPDPFEISASWGQEDFDCCPRTQLPFTTETEDSPPAPPRVITSIVQSKAAANENCNNMRRKLLIKVGNRVLYYNASYCSHS